MIEYKKLIKNWVIQKNNEGLIFKHDGDIIAESTISTMFFEQIIKKSLARFVWVAGDSIDRCDSNLERLPSLIELFEPIYEKALSPSFVLSELSEEQEELVQKLPVETFGAWVLYMLENDVKNNADSLENVFRGENSF